MSEGRDSINESLQKRAKAHRLPTLQPARDLTLGAKRVFLPNVNAKKTKEPETKPEPKKERPEKPKKREHRPPREKKVFQKKEYVQSYSMFAEGAATGSRENKTARLSGFGGGSGSGFKGDAKGDERGIRLGGLKRGGVGGVSDGLGRLSVKKEEDGGAFISDIDAGYMQPIVYPRKDPCMPRPLPSEFFLKHADDDEYEELAIIQMVNPMPVLSISSGNPEKDDAPEDLDFTHLPEGELGKLQVLDTGEVRLVIGDKGAMLDVLQGTPVDHLVELVRVRQTEDPADAEEQEGVVRDRNGEMSVLGRVQTRFVCSVNFDDVFDDMAVERDARGHDSDSDTDEPR